MKLLGDAKLLPETIAQESQHLRQSFSCPCWCARCSSLAFLSACKYKMEGSDGSLKDDLRKKGSSPVHETSSSDESDEKYEPDEKSDEAESDESVSEAGNIADNDDCAAENGAAESEARQAQAEQPDGG